MKLQSVMMRLFPSYALYGNGRDFSKCSLVEQQINPEGIKKYRRCVDNKRVLLASGWGRASSYC